MDLETNINQVVIRVQTYLEEQCSVYKFVLFLHGDSMELVGYANPILTLEQLPAELGVGQVDLTWFEATKRQIMDKVGNLVLYQLILPLIVFKQVDADYTIYVKNRMDDSIKEKFVEMYGTKMLYPANLHNIAEKMILFSTNLHWYAGRIPAATPAVRTTSASGAHASTSHHTTHTTPPLHKVTHYTPVQLHSGRNNVPSWVSNLLVDLERDVRLLEVPDSSPSLPTYPVSHFSNPLLKHVFLAGTMGFLERWPHLRNLYSKRNPLPRLSFSVASGRVSDTLYRTYPY